MTRIPATIMESTPAMANASGRRRSPLLGLRLTFAGLLAVVVTVLVAVASFTSEANLLLLLCGIACGLLAFNLVACVRTVRRIDVERSISGTAVAGRPFRIIYTVRNRRRWTRAWTVVISESPRGFRGSSLDRVLVPCLAPGEERRVEMTATCPKRGRIRLAGIRVSCGFPFGLFTCHSDIDLPAEVLVYPAVGRVRRDFWHLRAAAQSPASRRLDRGAADDEFHGVREYRQGDNPRWIHWRRSARTGELVVREHEAIRESQLICLVDPWPEQMPPRPVRGSRFQVADAAERQQVDAKVERVISAAATALCEALDRGYRVGLVCRAAVPVVVAPAGGRAHRRRLLEELALSAPGSTTGLDQMISGIRWSGNWNARCLLFTAQPRDTHTRVLRMLAARSESLLLISPQSGWLDKLFDLTGVAPQERGPTP